MAVIAFVTETDAAHRGAYQQALRDIDEVGDVLLVDPTGGTFNESRAVIGPKTTSTFASVDALVTEVVPDLAIVSMIAAHAPPIIHTLLESGIHVMAEKPACVRPADFAALVQRAAAKDRHLMLALADRLRADVLDARRIVQSGGIGSLFAVQVTQVDDQARIQARLHDPDWTFRRELAGGGHLAWLGIHNLDQVLYVTGDRVVEVGAMTPVVGGAAIDVEDLAMVHMRLAGGAHVSVFSGYLMDRKGHSATTYYGSDGWVRLNMFGNNTLEWHSTQSVMHGAHDRRITYTGQGAGYTEWVRAVVRASMDAAPAPVTGVECLDVLRVIHAAYAAAESGKTVMVSE